MSFDSAIAQVLKNEGGLVDNPADPGGLTNWGIALHENPDLTADQIRTMTRDQAVAFYKTRFWDKIQGDSLDTLVAFQILDFAVNAGLGTAIRKAQDVAGVADDGNWGPITRDAVAKVEPLVFVARYAATKIRFYTRLTTFESFGRGWMQRVAADLDFISLG
jgi:lysozyme family protein